MNKYCAYNDPITVREETKDRTTIEEFETWAKTTIYARGEWAVAWKEAPYVYAELFQTKQGAEIFYVQLKEKYPELDNIEIVPVN